MLDGKNKRITIKGAQSLPNAKAQTLNPTVTAVTAVAAVAAAGAKSATAQRAAKSDAAGSG